MKQPTQRQQFIIDMRLQGASFDAIGVAYQKQFKTKAKLTRSQIQNILAGFGLWGERYFRGKAMQINGIEYLTVAEAASALDCSQIWVRELVRRGTLKSEKIATARLVEKASVEQFKQRRG